MSKNRTRSFVIILGLLLFTILQAEAQNRNRPTWVSFYLGHNEYHGDLGNEMLRFKLGYDWTIGLALDQYLNKYMDLEISAIYGELDYNNFFNTSFINSQAILQVKPVRSRFVIDPFVGTGIGINRFWNSQSSIDNNLSFHVPLQVGFDYNVSRNIAVTANATYNRTFTNSIDGSDFDDMGHDDFLIYSVGIKLSLNKSRDTDGDGIINKNDLCPNSYGTSFWGCPDTDNDGLDDNEDNCPSVAGAPVMNGCPDMDGDGVDDSIDSCPDVKGSHQSRGCPDEDGDGVPTPEDKCPDQTGIASNNGCPDGTDSAAVTKRLSSDLEANLAEFSNSITFATGITSLDSTAKSNLDQLAEIMVNDRALQLIIRAYTDNSGSSSQNLELSVARANAVKKYLVEKGLAENRLYAFGYGQAKPVSSNDTAEGRAKNRRIELQLYYK